MTKKALQSKRCKCISYNRPDLGGTKEGVVVNNIFLDACIVDQIKALWSAGVKTVGSCCSHNGYFGPAPTVFLKDAWDAELAADTLKASDPKRPWHIIVWSHGQPSHPNNA